MVNLFYYVKAEIWGNKFTKLGNRTLATFEELDDAKKYVELYRAQLGTRTNGWIFLSVYDQYGQKRKTGI